VFSLNVGELVVILVIVVVIFGATPLRGSDGSRWSRTDWMLVLAALASGFVAWALDAAR
jgi:hypothetical protein